MSDQMTCPHCGSDWTGSPIPDEHRHMYGNATHFKREIAIYDRDADRTVAFQCPDCNTTFDRQKFKPTKNPWATK